ncbi:MAG: hypothetical protein QNJ58_02290 [Desulfobacterales bacterium]|nr:hypothetical protein [Desulfobacterales bacterium]
MFSGVQEILVLVIIILGILFLPRILNRGQENRPAAASPAFTLSGRMRLALAASVIWPALIAAFLQPWKQDLITFLYVGPGPVVVLWIVYWVITGFKNK